MGLPDEAWDLWSDLRSNLAAPWGSYRHTFQEFRIIRSNFLAQLIWHLQVWTCQHTSWLSCCGLTAEGFHNQPPISASGLEVSAPFQCCSLARASWKTSQAMEQIGDQSVVHVVLVIWPAIPNRGVAKEPWETPAPAATGAPAATSATRATGAAPKPRSPKEVPKPKPLSPRRVGAKSLEQSTASASGIWHMELKSCCAIPLVEVKPNHSIENS